MMLNQDRCTAIVTFALAGVMCAGASAQTAKPAAKAKPKSNPRVASAAHRAVGMVDIAARPRVAVRSVQAARKKKATVRRVTSTRRSTSASVASRRTIAISRQPGMGRRGAFSPAPLQSKAGLMKQLRNSPSLRRNLSTHFGVPESRLVSYIDNNLNFDRLRKPMTTYSFGVSKRTGKIFKVRQRLPKGTPVFALSDRTPVIKEICANPVVFYLPPVPKPVAQFGPIQPPGVLTIDVTPTPVGGRPTLPGTLPVTAYLPPTADMDIPPTFEVAYSGETVGSMDIIPGAVSRGGGGAFPWWIAGGGVPFFFLDDDDDDGDQLVPEPNSIALFAAGGVPLIAWWKRRRREKAEAGPETAETPSDIDAA